MSLASALREAATSPEKGCQMCSLFSAEKLTEDDVQALKDALSSKIGYKALGRILRQNGYTVPDEHIRLHRSERHGV